MQFHEVGLILISQRSKTFYLGYSLGVNKICRINLGF